MMIEIENIQKSFNHRNVLKGVSLRVEKGEILAVIGGSGVGKSVLLKHIAALMRPDRGSIVVNNLEVARLKGRALEEYRDHLGYLFQGGALFDSMNVYDNIAFPLREKTRLKEKKMITAVRATIVLVSACLIRSSRGGSVGGAGFFATCA